MRNCTAKNRDMDPKETTIFLIKKGIEAVDPHRIVKKNLSVKDEVLEIKGKRFELKDFDQVYIAGIGKASGTMAEAVERLLTPTNGIIITKKGVKAHLKRIKLIFGHHPTPEEENVDAARKILDLADRANERTLFIFLISGGGSALFCAPVSTISLANLKKTNQLLLQSGANIHEINSVRKHLSQVKGGRFAKKAMPATLISLILSDVVGDNLDVIASGPTSPDTTTYSDATRVLKKYDIWEESPASVRNHLSRGKEGKEEESLKEELPNVHNFIIGNNLMSLEAVEKEANHLGYKVLIISSQIEGEAREVGIAHAGIAKEVKDSSHPISPPAVILSGGELTVTIKEGYREGGPNREFVLGAATKIKGRKGIAVGAVDTDGTDGTGKSGAVADGSTISRGKGDPYKYLREHNTQEYFDQLGDSIDLGETGTNVNDLRVMVIE